MAQAPAHLLWTGGWDSTYRLLDLVFVRDHPVRTYYVVDEGRPSHQKEIGATDRISAAVRARTGKEVPKPVIVNLTEIAPDAEVCSAFERLVSHLYLGPQYEWLARFAHQFGPEDGLELCIHRDDRVYPILKSMRSGGPLARDTSVVFGGFRFPLLELTKLDMQDQAVKAGFADILETTWFCHRGGRSPCGTCAPCRYAIAEGMGRRVGWRGRLRNRASLLRRRLPLPRALVTAADRIL